MNRHLRLSPLVLLMLVPRLGSAAVDYNSEIRPILSDQCYQCHGPDEGKRKAKLRFDTREGMLRERDGRAAVVPGQPGQSALLTRIRSTDPEEVMPPPESKKSLTEAQKALLERWIAEGAKWEKQWSLVPPRKPDLPAVTSPEAVRNPIDRFIQARLEAAGLQPSPSADKERLLRRVTMDLTGLPPVVGEMDAFLADDSPDAYERVVDRLLKSQAHAERLALDWMDVARYADSHGMHADGYRLMWPWRDWVIRAFEANMPYDQFVTWQMAGDLMPHPTQDQILATAFHRNHPMTAEGGAIDEEFRMLYVFDRAQTTATAFLGMTLECARCHDHKFDPVAQRDYYRFASFFNNVKELGMTGDDDNYGPLLPMTTPEQQARLDALDKALEETRSTLATLRSKAVAERDAEARLRAHPLASLPEPRAHYPFDKIETVKLEKDKTERRVDGMEGARVEGNPEQVEGKLGGAFRFGSEYDLLALDKVGLFDLHQPYTAAAWVRTERLGHQQSLLGTAGDKNNFWRGWDFFLDTENRPSLKLISALPHNLIHVRGGGTVPTNTWTHVMFTYDGSGRAEGVRFHVNGRPLESTALSDSLYRSIHPVNGAAKRERDERPIRVGKSYRSFTGEYGIFRGSMDDVRLWDAALTPAEVALLWHRMQPVSEPLDLQRVGREGLIGHDLCRHDTEYQSVAEELRRLVKERMELMESIPEVMVMEEMARPRVTHVLRRGQYDAPQQAVEPGTPESILPFGDDRPPNRLGLAAWLFDPDNPLTARVTVNRYWQVCFGQGLVKTSEDFGSQGDMPTHPALLDWLAVRFRESGWDVRNLIRLMVTSEAYRRSSIATPEQRQKDPTNRLLARGPSHRLPAEMIRDHALAAAGLLEPTVGGPSVKPYQPEGLWIEKGNFSSKLLHYKPDKGPLLYRRSLYTFLRRTSPHPMMVTFDAPNRDVCTVRRERTSTPLQALVLLNDPQFVEAARVMAERLQEEAGAEPRDQLALAFRLLTGRHAKPAELDVLLDLRRAEVEHFMQDPAAAEALLSVGDHARRQDLPAVETAALAMVANMLMNHDDFYMKR